MPFIHSPKFSVFFQPNWCRCRASIHCVVSPEMKHSALFPGSSATANRTPGAIEVKGLHSNGSVDRKSYFISIWMKRSNLSTSIGLWLRWKFTINREICFCRTLRPDSVSDSFFWKLSVQLLSNFIPILKNILLGNFHHGALTAYLQNF